MQNEIVVEDKKIDEIIAKHSGCEGALLKILEEVQDCHKNKYLPEITLATVAKKTNTPASAIYSVVTFYAFFNLKPQGEHTIVICRGTACHTRRSKELLEYLKKILDVEEDYKHRGEKLFLTTKDNKFTIRTVACFGQCALAPVVEIDGVIYSRVTEDSLGKIIKKVSGKKMKKNAN